MIPDSYDPRQVGELFLVADAVLDTPATAAQIGPGEAAWQSTPCPLAPVGDTTEKRPTSTPLPLRDMRPYCKLLAGASWMAEYGDPTNPRLRRSSRRPVDDAEVRHCMITASQN